MAAFIKMKQRAHWTREQVTIHPMVTNYCCPDDGEIVTESVVFNSKDPRHDSHAVHHFGKMLMEELHSCGLSSKVVHFSNGCASQHKGQISFADAIFGIFDYGVQMEKHFLWQSTQKGTL